MTLSENGGDQSGQQVVFVDSDESEMKVQATFAGLNCIC